MIKTTQVIRRAGRSRLVAIALGLAASFGTAAARAQETPPPPTLTPDAAPPPPAVDLSTLGIQDESQRASDDERPLQLYGFADLTYYMPFFPKDSFLAASLPENQQFVMGNFNLYLAKQISERLRALGEVRFMYLPNGQISGNRYVSTQADDPADLYRPIRWGGIAIERLHVEYDVLSSLTVRVGQFLTPYGIWNVDHGTPTIISIRRPYIIGEAVFPQRQIGVEVFGRKYLWEIGVEYHLTLSNGRGPVDETRDLDTNKAVGARLLLQWKRDFDLKVGFSYYRGRVTNATPLSFDVMTGKATSTILERYDEQALAADLSLDVRGLVVRSEILGSDHRYTDDGRGTGPVFTPDNRRWGVYGLVGYHLPYGLLPFVLAQYYKFPESPGNDITVSVRAYQAGLNYRLHPSVILKAEYSYATLSDSPIAIIRDTPLHVVETQASWVF
jgi:hypothetical protein